MAPAADRPLHVVAVNEPLAFFARRIGGERVDARCPAPSGSDPADWQPGDDDLLRIQEADMILLDGAGHARWVDTASLPSSKLVDTSVGFRDRLIQIEGTLVHSHGQTAITTWLDLGLACQQADAVFSALQRVLAAPTEELAQRHALLVEELRRLDADLERWGASLEGAPLLASHPVYQYLARAYGLRLESVHWEPGEDPSEADWKGLTDLLGRHPAQWMLWEGPPSRDTGARLEALGVRSVVVDPCGAPPREGDFLSVMQANLERLRAAGCGSF